MWIKICGTTNLEDAELAIAAGANALGFVFAPSPRQVTAEQVRQIVPQLPRTIEKFGVFAGASFEEIASAVLECGLTGVQLHGLEDSTLPMRLRQYLLAVSDQEKSSPGRLGIISALHYGTELEQQLRAFHGDHATDAVLVDARNGAVVGGTGTVFDWAGARNSFFRSAPHLRLIAAGGLRPENVREAIYTLHPWGVDVVTGVESAPGRKDPQKLRQFVMEARAAAAEIHRAPEPAQA